MGEPVSLGRRFSRDRFLCLGGAMGLTARGSLAGNLPDVIRVGDWPVSELSGVLFTATIFAACGAIFLVAAHGLLTGRPWDACLTLVLSALALTFLVFAVYGEAVERAEFTISLSFYAVPLLFTFIWALGQTVRGWKEQGLDWGTEGRSKQIA
jgi:drug/metabolite transporter (DMT)-like permease